MKLDKLKGKRIEGLNNILAGDSRMGLGFEPIFTSCICTDDDDCGVYTWPNGTQMPISGTWTED